MTDATTTLDEAAPLCQALIEAYRRGHWADAADFHAVGRAFVDAAKVTPAARLAARSTVLTLAALLPTEAPDGQEEGPTPGDEIDPAA